MRHLRVLCLAFAAAGCPSNSPATDAGVVPSAPSAVTATAQTATIQVGWSAATADVTEFVIARAIVPAMGSVPAQTELATIGSAPSTATTFDDADVEPGHFYVYAVSARGAGGKSSFTLMTGTVSLTAMGSSCAKNPVTATDSDGDGLADADENTGWDVLVDEDGTGTLTTREVKSSPFAADTDGDGICDPEESSLKLDPRQSDTDGDGLSDFDEVNRWGSSATNVDSDMDSHGNSAFYDGAELMNFGTSPTLADTDGDGRSDFEEINQNGTNALVAEVPQPKLEVVSAVDISVDIMTSTGMMMANAVTTRQEKGTTNTLGKTSSSATTQSIESSFEVTAEASAGYPSGASVKASGTYSEKEGYVQETSTSISRQSQQSSEDTYEQLSSQLISQEQTVTGGHLAVDFEIQNLGTRTFKLSSVVVTALRRDRTNPATFTSIATLTFPPSADNLVLAEGQSAGPIRASAAISGNVALDLLSNPGAIFFRTANFNLTDQTGTAFQFAIGETTSSRTAQLTLDYGGVRPLERYRVATNVERTASGKAAGTRLGDALSRALGLAPGVGYQTTQRTGTSKQIVTRVRDVATTQQPDGGSDHFWVVIAPENPDPNLGSVSDRLLPATIDIDDAVLMPRDSLTLAYVADHDGDGLYEREELIYGTYDSQPDSDGDGLTDFEEVRTGWTVSVDNPFYLAHPKVYSVPTAIDADQDGWSDAVEKMKGTDPNRKDTDSDGLIDSIDPAPTQGPKGTWGVYLGTAGDEQALQVLAEGDTVWVLGTSTGDIDGDSASGGPFIAALDSATGTRKWTVQLEGTNAYSKRFVVLNGTVQWVAEVLSGVLPGVTARALYTVHITKAGAATATDMTNFGNIVGSTTLANFFVSTQQPAPGGGFLTFGAYTFNNPGLQYAVKVLSLDAAGTSGSATGYGGSGTVTTIGESASNGLLAAVVETTGPACRVDLFRGTTLAGFVGYCGAMRPGTPAKVAIDHYTAVYAQIPGGSADTLERVAPSGGLVWSRNFAPDFPSPRITALDIDDSDHVFVGLSQGGQPAGLEILLPDQTRQVLLRIGNGTTRLTSTRRDAVGNVYSAGHSIGGLPSTFGTPPGGLDVVITRNPQITFEP
ncbi:MAG: hypothetical protein IPJ65_03545 [Archangiaceae bacterium]|nr:hypothetical protein [Archangiaceae bacterium]